MVPRTQTPEVAVHAAARLGEGPTWETDRERLIWVDILASRVHTYAPASGARTVLDTGQYVGAAKPRVGGGLVVNLRDGVGCYDADGAFRWLHREPVPGRRGNDAGVAPDGALWAGTMRIDEAPLGGTLSRYTGTGEVTLQLPSVSVSNGIGWSPDGALLYYIDTPTRRIDVFRPQQEGDTVQLGERRTLVEIEEGAGFPDGLTVDALGCVWVALWDGGAIRRYTPQGELDGAWSVPAARPTACTFGGPELRDLYVTTARIGEHPAVRPLAGSVLVFPGIGEGQPGTAFAG